MMPNHYDRERMAQAHLRELLREAEHERLMAELPRPKWGGLRIALRLKLSWQAIRMRLQHGF